LQSGQNFSVTILIVIVSSSDHEGVGTADQHRPYPFEFESKFNATTTSKNCQALFSEKFGLFYKLPPHPTPDV